MYVLGRMKANGWINEQQYKQAVAQPILVAKGTTKDATDAGGYVAEMVRQMLYDKFGDKIYTEGYKVYTTIDSKMQEAGYTALRNGLLQYDAASGFNGAEQQLNLKEAGSDEITDQAIMSSFDALSDFGDMRAAVVTDASGDSLKVKTRDGNELQFKGSDLDFVRKYLTSGGNRQLSRGSVVRVRNVNGKWTLTQLPVVEGGLIALSPTDGAMKALVGGFDFTKNNYNHVTQAMRQPGSGFKPFIYSSALEKGLSANTEIDDSEICFPTGGDGGGQWCPRNDDNRFLGTITMRQGLTFSRNVVTVKILNQITPHYAIDYVSKFGFNKSQFQPYLTMALGASEVTPMQMAQAYAVFANGGYLVTPYLIKTISDNKGNILAKTDPVDIHKNQTVIDPRNAYIMNSMMQDVARYGTGARAYKELKRNDIAGKTGTTTDAKDVWFNGYTPKLVAITWVGFDQPKSLGAHQFGSTLALPIWISFMRQALNGIPETQLPMPGGITVLHNATWKGNDEYVYDGSKPFTALTGSETDASAPVASPTPNANSSAPVAEGQNSSAPQVAQAKPQVAPAAKAAQEASAPTQSNQGTKVDDIIQNIQD